MIVRLDPPVLGKAHRRRRVEIVAAQIENDVLRRLLVVYADDDSSIGAGFPRRRMDWLLPMSVECDLSSMAVS